MFRKGHFSSFIFQWEMIREVNHCKSGLCIAGKYLYSKRLNILFVYNE